MDRGKERGGWGSVKGIVRDRLPQQRDSSSGRKVLPHTAQKFLNCWGRDKAREKILGCGGGRNTCLVLYGLVLSCIVLSCLACHFLSYLVLS